MVQWCDVIGGCGQPYHVAWVRQGSSSFDRGVSSPVILFGITLAAGHAFIVIADYNVNSLELTVVDVMEPGAFPSFQDGNGPSTQRHEGYVSPCSVRVSVMSGSIESLAAWLDVTHVRTPTMSQILHLLTYSN
jgi:hypothetical protein